MQKIKRNGQLTIPKEIRERFRIKDGDWVQTNIEGNQIVIRVIETPQYRELQQA